MLPRILPGLLLVIGISSAVEAASIIEGAVDVPIDARTSAEPLNRTTAPRLGVLDKAPYVGIIRFAVQPGASYTLLEVYPAEPTHRMLLTGYYPLSQDKRPIKGKDGSRTSQSVKTASKTGRWGYRSNFSVDPKSNGRYVYYVYFSETPSVAFQVQLYSKQLPAAEVRDNNDSPYSGAKGYFWGDPDVGAVFAEVLPDEPERKTGGNDPLTTTVTTKPPGDPGKTTTDRKGDQDPTNAGKMTIKVESRKVRSGQSVTVPVQLLNGADLASVNVVIDYDARGAEVTVRPEQGPIYEPLEVILFEANYNVKGTVRFGHATTDELNGSGTLTSMTFRVTGAAGAVIPLKVKVTSANDSTGRPLTVNTINGEIVIEGEGTTSTGDPDGDGVATVADAKNALKMSVKLIPEDLICDVDRDGTVTANDARILLARATRAGK